MPDRYHQHSKKRIALLLSGGNVGVPAVILEPRLDEVFTAIPVMTFPAPVSGNISKLKIAVTMLMIVRQAVYELSL